MPIEEKSEIKNESINTEYLLELMQKADIPGASIAFRNRDGSISTLALGVETSSKTPMTSEVSLGAASLSKPVFAYLVLELIARRILVLNRSGEPPESGLDRPLYEVAEFGPLHLRDHPYYRRLTVRLILSHQSGFPITHDDRTGPVEFDFEPGSGKFAYSGIPFGYLQEVVENLTGKTLGLLAQEFVFTPLGMNHSSFGKVGRQNAANSLYTTASDYVRFVTAWINSNNLQYAFHNQISMTQDEWAIKEYQKKGLSIKELEKIGWGLGFALQKNNQGEITGIFHTGDMNEFRAFVAANNDSATVILTNGTNGYLLVDPIISETVGLEDGRKYFFEKFPFARKLTELDPSSPGLKLSFTQLAKETKEVKESSVSAVTTLSTMGIGGFITPLPSLTDLLRKAIPKLGGWYNFREEGLALPCNNENEALDLQIKLKEIFSEQIASNKIAIDFKTKPSGLTFLMFKIFNMNIQQLEQLLMLHKDKLILVETETKNLSVKNNKLTF